MRRGAEAVEEAVRAGARSLPLPVRVPGRDAGWSAATPFLLREERPGSEGGSSKRWAGGSAEPRVGTDPRPFLCRKDLEDERPDAHGRSESGG